MSFVLSIFRLGTYIMHHFTFLVWLPTRIFSNPITYFSPPPKTPLFRPKTPLVSSYFALFGPVFRGSKRFYLYNCCVFLCLLSLIQQHFAMRLAAKRTAFSTKTHCIQHQNALYLAAKYTAFSTKTHCILQQIARKWVQMAFALNKYSFWQHSHATPFCTETNLRENRLFAARWAIGGQKGHSEC